MTRGALILLVLSLALAPRAASAQVTDPVAAAIKMCVTSGPKVEERVLALAAAGWQTLAPGPERAPVVAALAHFDVVRIGVLSGDQTLAEVLPRLVERLQREADQEFPGDYWMMLPDDTGFLRLYAPRTGIAQCILSTAITAAELGQLVGAQVAPMNSGIGSMSSIMSGDSPLTSIDHFTFSPEIQGDLAILPLLYFPPVFTSE